MKKLHSCARGNITSNFSKLAAFAIAGLMGLSAQSMVKADTVLDFTGGATGTATSTLTGSTAVNGTIVGTNAGGGSVTSYFEVGSVHPAGSGVFNPFLTVQNKGQEQGYNTDGAPQFDEKRQPTWTHSLTLASLQAVIAPNGVLSYEFLLDVNEQANGKSLISLDDLRIYQTSDPNADHLTLGSDKFTDDGTSVNVFDLDTKHSDNTLLLNYNVVGRGSGSSDLNVYIPVSVFTSSDPYVVLYSHFGGYSTPYASGAGYEEWAAIQTGATPSVPSAPLPATASMGLALIAAYGLVGMAMKLRCREVVA